MKRRKYVFGLLAAVVLLALPISASVATSAQSLTFNLKGTYRTNDAAMAEWLADQSVSAVINGGIKITDEKTLLSPLEGNITIGDATYQISVRPIDKSEPIIVSHIGPNTFWLAIVRLYIGAHQFNGQLAWNNHTDTSTLSFEGIQDGSLVNAELSGCLPE